MSRRTLTRIIWLIAALVAGVVAAFAVQNVMAGPEDRELGPVVVNTHEPVPTPAPSQETQEPDEPSEPAQPDAATSHPVQPAPPVVVEQYDDDDWDDDDWDDDDWDDDDDDDWDDDDWDDDDDD